ncbi:MAG: radical SAM protein [Proteobacteria bacterium]|nr:radical SAM protein [Pseudomonadota bacterium]
MRVLQVHPTHKCNLACRFCPYQSCDDELPVTDFMKWISVFHQHGCTCLKVSGGGEPTCYPYLEDALVLARMLGMTICLQTNGLRLTEKIADLCDDIRVSCGDGRVFVPSKVLPTGFSYVVTQNPDYDNLNNVVSYAVKHKCYIRITQDDRELDDIPTIEEIKKHIVYTDTLLISSRSPELFRLSPGNSLIRFWDALDYHVGSNPCPCHSSPLLSAYGWFPCCKTHVAHQYTGGGYDMSMCLGETLPAEPYDGSSCTRCYY